MGLAWNRGKGRLLACLYGRICMCVCVCVCAFVWKNVSRRGGADVLCRVALLRPGLASWRNSKLTAWRGQVLAALGMRGALSRCKAGPCWHGAGRDLCLKTTPDRRSEKRRGGAGAARGGLRNGGEGARSEAAGESQCARLCVLVRLCVRVYPLKYRVARVRFRRMCATARGTARVCACRRTRVRERQGCRAPMDRR